MPILARLLVLLLLVAPVFAGPDEAVDPFDPSWKKEYAPEDDFWRDTPQVFVFNNGSEPETLDPGPMTGVPEHTLALALYEGLVMHHPETLEPRPGAAERWEVSPDGKTYTFHLRKDAKWSNGDPVTAEDFRWSWYRVFVPKLRADYTYLLYYIQGAKEFHESAAEGGYEAFKEKVAVEVPDPYTLRVTLIAPTAFFLDLCAFETYMPVHRPTVEKHGKEWTRPENHVGNGPFVLKEWKPRQHIVMTKSPTYWDRGFVKLERIVALPVDDVDVSFNKFLKGECDWIRTVPTSKIEQAQRMPEYYVMPYLGSYFYRVNVTREHLESKLVRRALSLAINREVITRDITRGGQIPADWFCPAVVGYEPPEGLGYAPDKARELLAQAGYPDGKGFPPLELVYNSSENHKKIALALAQMWRENLGIRVQLRNLEWKVYLNDVEDLKYDVARAGWIGDYSDPNTFLDMFVTDGGNNSTGWSNARYDELIEKAKYEADPKKRFELFREAERILITDEFPIIPLYIYVNQGMLRDTVQGWYENVRDLHPFQFIWMEK